MLAEIFFEIEFIIQYHNIIVSNRRIEGIQLSIFLCWSISESLLALVGESCGHDTTLGGRVISGEWLGNQIKSYRTDEESEAHRIINSWLAN